MAKSRHSKKRVHRRRSSKMTGGDCGAAQHAVDTFGGVGNQHAAGPHDNTIAMSHGGNVATVPVVTGGSPIALMPAVVGGGSAPLTPALVTGGSAPLSPALVDQHQPLVKVPAVAGGGIITDIAVPAALLYTREVIRKRRLPGVPRFSMKKSRHYRRRSNRRSRR